MLRSKRTLSGLLLAASAVLTLAAAPSLAVVGGITDLAEFSSPASQYYGMNWSYNYGTKKGTIVSIGYFTLITAAHFDTAVDSTFQVANGDTFSVTGVEMLKTPDPNQSTLPDIRVLHVKNVTNQYRPLPGFYDLYTYPGGSNEAPDSFPTSAWDFAIVGTGDTGATTIPITDPPYYGYTPYYTDTGERLLRWGTNRYATLDRVDLTNKSDVTVNSTMCVKMLYDLPTSEAWTVHESGLGVGDSGGGVFVNDGGAWKLAGINLYRDSYEDLPDKYTDIYAASIPYYQGQLLAILQDDRLPGDLNLDGNVDAYDYITLKANYGKTNASWSQGDFNGDGLVGYADLQALAANIGYTSTPHPIVVPLGGGHRVTGGASMPEPGSAILLALGAAALLRRRETRRVDMPRS
jgi:hypothetical protein